MLNSIIGRVALVVAVALVLSICGCTANSGTNTATTNQIKSVSAPHPDGIFRIPLMTNPPDLDPILVSDTTSHQMDSKIFPTLPDSYSVLNL